MGCSKGWWNKTGLDWLIYWWRALLFAFVRNRCIMKFFLGISNQICIPFVSLSSSVIILQIGWKNPFQNSKPDWSHSCHNNRSMTVKQDCIRLDCIRRKKLGFKLQRILTGIQPHEEKSYSLRTQNFKVQHFCSINKPFFNFRDTVCKR